MVQMSAPQLWRLSAMMLVLSGSAWAEPTLEDRMVAAQQTAATNSYCTTLGPFYWEVGDASGKLDGATEGGNTPAADTQMLIASGTKWLFAAYVVERSAGAPSEEEIRALSMNAGYHDLHYGSCVRLRPGKQAQETAGQCFTSAGNDSYVAADVDHFYYNGGHFQALASQSLGMAPMTNTELAREMHSVLGNDVHFSFDSPQLAAGVKTSATDYAVFLRKLMSGELALGDLLGSHAVCTNPTTCSTALDTPVPETESWQYSLGHWVESDPAVGDGAYDSAGAFGFYPWISQDKHWYGILARQGDAGSAFPSIECGRLIRKAWVDGVSP